MNPPLNVHNAQISTAKVEIKTLTISGKQVTLAVFRQLIDELLIAEDGRLKGVAWVLLIIIPTSAAMMPHTGMSSGS